MTIGRNVEGEDHHGNIRKAHVHLARTAGDVPHAGLVTFTTPLVHTEPSTKFFFNAIKGIDMNVAVGFGGTPDRIHDGLDTTLYTGSAISGTKTTFNSTIRAQQAIATIVDFNIIDAGETVTVTVGGVQTVLTAGGTDWTAATSNNATATSLASALDGVSGVTATATGAVVTALSDFTEFVTSGEAGELIATGQSVITLNAQVGDTMQFARVAGDIDLNNFTAITMRIFVASDWAVGDSIQFYGYDTGLSVEVGTRINLEDYFEFGEFGLWHSVAIPLSDLGLASATTVDAWRVQIVAKSAQSPSFGIDVLQVEATGNPIIYELVVDPGDIFNIEELVFSYADVLDAQNNANASMPDLAYDQILALGKLPIGFIITRKKAGKTLFAATIRTLGDHISAGARADQPWSDGVNTFVTLRAIFDVPLRITGDVDDTITITINDQMGGLLQFRCAARGGLEAAP